MKQSVFLQGLFSESWKTYVSQVLQFSILKMTLPAKMYVS